MAGVEPTTSSLAASLTRELLHELVADIAIEEHALSQLRKHRLTQLYYEQSLNGSLAGTSPNKKDRDEGLFSCVVCTRQIAAPRYASHLSGCMGLSGSRRGERRAAANAAKPSRNGSAASSHGSDTDTDKKNGANGLKRSASSASASSQTKKSKPTPLVSAASQTFQPPHIGSHPLSKTMSLPASPVNSPTASYPPIPPRPASVVPGALPPHQQQQRLPSKSPAIAQNGTRPPHPLAHAQRPVAPLPPLLPSANRPTSAVTRNDDDRPDSDSEDSDSDLEIQPPRQPGPASGARSQKTPRVPPPSTANGGGAGLIAQRNGSTTGGGGQKQPRKSAPVVGQGAAGRKAARPIAGVNHDSASSDEDASDGSGSD